MANDFYNHSGYPATRTQGDSSSMRAQLAAIAAGFDKMPGLTGNATKLVRVNSGATALEAVSAIDGIAIGGSTPAAGSFTTLASSGAATLASLAVTGAATAATMRAGGATAGSIGVRVGGAYGGGGPLLGRDGIVVESNANTGISILTPNSNLGGIAFGDAANNLACRLEFDHATDEFGLIVPGAQYKFNASGALFAGVMNSDSVTSNSTIRASGAVLGTIGVRTGGAYGGAGPNSGFDDLVIEANTGAGMTILTPNSVTAGYLIGNDSDNSAAGMTYVHSTSRLNILAGGATRQIIDGSSGHIYTVLPTSAPTLPANSQLSMHLTSNTNLRISVRGSDGTTRVANITLA